jgi:hypothetical protein
MLGVHKRFQGTRHKVSGPLNRDVRREEKDYIMKLRITHIPPIRASLTIAGVCAVLILITTIVITIYATGLGNTSHSPAPPYSEILLVAGGVLPQIAMTPKER